MMSVNLHQMNKPALPDMEPQTHDTEIESLQGNKLPNIANDQPGYFVRAPSGGRLGPLGARSARRGELPAPANSFGFLLRGLKRSV